MSLALRQVKVRGVRIRDERGVNHERQRAATTNATTTRRRERHRCWANQPEREESVETQQPGIVEDEVAGRPKATRRRKAESTDAISSALSRRFGLKGGLAWVGVLAAGVIGEQVKTRLEVRREKQNTVEVRNAKEVSTASGLSYQDFKVRTTTQASVPQIKRILFFGFTAN